MIIVDPRADHSTLLGLRPSRADQPVNINRMTCVTITDKRTTQQGPAAVFSANSSDKTLTSIHESFLDVSRRKAVSTCGRGRWPLIGHGCRKLVQSNYVAFVQGRESVL